MLDGSAVAVDLKQDAEDDYIDRVQETLRRRVWNAGCASVCDILDLDTARLTAKSGISMENNGMRWRIPGHKDTTGIAAYFLCGLIGHTRYEYKLEWRVIC